MRVRFTQPRKRFPGQTFQAETGLHYNYFRDYDPAIGRYIESDPIGFAGGLNTYGYVGGNPVNYVDPTGEFPVFLALLGGAAAGAAWGAIIDVGLQLYDNGGRLSCLDFKQVGQSAAVGAATGAIFGGIGGFAAKGARGFGRGAAGAGDAAAGGLGKEIGILRDAAKGKGNFGLGSGTRAEANKLGRAWVGDGYKVSGNGKAWISKDGSRQYRLPSYKPRSGKTQANFEQRYPNQRSTGWQGNGHLDITD